MLLNNLLNPLRWIDFFTYSFNSGSSSTPTQTTTNTASIPAYAQPYVEKALGQTAALTDINQNPYQPYQGQRFADFTPMQNQAFGNIANMQPSSQLGQGTDIANQASQGGMGYGAMGALSGLSYGRNAQDPNVVASYMSPYMQNVVNTQQREANRQYDIAGAQEMSNATRANAFGGSREALMAAENERNRNTALNQIQATGSQNAFQNAQQNMQQAATLGIQGAQTGISGLNTALQGANTLNTLGNSQYTQGMGINQAQLAAGTQQQQAQQAALDYAYQQYQDSLNYPYKQLAFQSDMFRGLPLSQSAQNVYQNPSMVSQAAGLGTAAMGAYGMYKMFNKGGSVGGDGLDTLGMYNAMRGQ